MSEFFHIPRFSLLMCAALAAAFFSAVSLYAREPLRTTVTSETIEMQGTDERNFFYFRKDVEVRGTNLEIRCDELTVIAGRAGAAEEGFGEIGAIESIVAVGNVVIVQEGRTAYAGRAEVNPRAGTVTLSENPRVVDGDVEVEGYQFVLFRDERRFASVPDPDAPPDRPSRSVVRLGELPDLGFSQDEERIRVGRDAERREDQTRNNDAPREYIDPSRIEAETEAPPADEPQPDEGREP